MRCVMVSLTVDGDLLTPTENPKFRFVFDKECSKIDYAKMEIGLQLWGKGEVTSSNPMSLIQCEGLIGAQRNSYYDMFWLSNCQCDYWCPMFADCCSDHLNISQQQQPQQQQPQPQQQHCLMSSATTFSYETPSFCFSANCSKTRCRFARKLRFSVSCTRGHEV